MKRASTGRVLAIVGLVGGLGFLVAIVLRVGPGRVLADIGAIGWGFLLVLAFRACLVVLMGASWRVLGGDDGRAGVGVYAAARLIRDSASECLPLSQVGGFVLGARALVVAGVSGVHAAASTIVDVTAELVAQIAYLAVGLLLLRRLRPELPLLRPIGIGLAILAAGALVFLLIQARGSVLAERGVSRVLKSWTGVRTGASAVVRAVAAIHRRPGRVLAGVALHAVDWFGNGVEAWLTLLLMGHRIGFRDAIVIDSLLYGIRSFAFAVPNALGVQEAAYVVLGALFGLGSGTALALSLLRRARDFTLGIPALATWQFLEGRRVWRGFALVDPAR